MADTDSEFTPFNYSQPDQPNKPAVMAPGASADPEFAPFEYKGMPEHKMSTGNWLHAIGNKGVYDAPVVGPWMANAVAAGKSFMQPYLGTGVDPSKYEQNSGKPITYEQLKKLNLENITGGRETFEQEHPISSRLSGLLGSTAATAPLFAAAGEVIPPIGGYGLMRNAARFGTDVASAGTVGTGISLADRLSKKGFGGLSADDFYSSAGEGYGGAAAGTTLGRALGPGFNYFLSKRGEKALPTMVSEQNKYTDAQIIKFAQDHPDPFVKGSVPPSGELSDMQRRAIITAMSPEERFRLDEPYHALTAMQEGKTMTQLKREDPKLAQSMTDASKKYMKNAIQEKFGPDTLNSAIYRAIEGGIGGGILGHVPGAVIGGTAGVAAHYMPQAGSFLAHQTIPRTILQSPAGQAAIQEISRNKDKYSQMPGMAFDMEP